MTTIHFRETVSNISKPTCALRWVPRSAMQAHDLKLQQAFEVEVLDSTGSRWKRYTEWRDVPVEHNP